MIIDSCMTKLYQSLCFTFAALLPAFDAIARSTPTDGDWSAQFVVLHNTAEAECVIRVGDVDNLGFLFPEHMDPFSGHPTPPHPFPFDPSPEDAPGTDRIMIGSGFTGADFPAGQDGYSYDWHPETRPLTRQTIEIPLAPLKELTIRDALLCLFVDDFQAPTFKSRFTVTFNGRRFPEMESLLNRIDQTGPIGKVIYVRFSQEMLQTLSEEKLQIDIDDPMTKAGDGFAIDFAKLMINVRVLPYRGSISGRVLDDATGVPVPSASVDAASLKYTTTDSSGAFVFQEVPAGLVVVTAAATGYSSASVTTDVLANETGTPIEIRLKPSPIADFSGEKVREGDRITLERIQFDLNRAELRMDGMAELDKVAAFLKSNPEATIELSGHTSSEGSAQLNRDLSFRRVQSCKDYLVSRGIDPGRLITIGYGPDRPIAPNDTETNRAKNRRVEMRFIRLQTP